MALTQQTISDYVQHLAFVPCPPYHPFIFDPPPPLNPLSIPPNPPCPRIKAKRLKTDLFFNIWQADIQNRFYATLVFKVEKENTSLTSFNFWWIKKKGRDIFISIKIRLKIIVHLTKYYEKNIQKNNKSMRKKKCIFLLLLLLNLHQLLLKTLEIHSAREDLKKIKLHTKNFLFWDLCEKKYIPI